MSKLTKKARAALDSGKYVAINVPSDFDWDLFRDLDEANGYGGSGMIELESENILLVVKKQEADMRKLVAETIEMSTE